MAYCRLSFASSIRMLFISPVVEGIIYRARATIGSFKMPGDVAAAVAAGPRMYRVGSRCPLKSLEYQRRAGRARELKGRPCRFRGGSRDHAYLLPRGPLRGCR